MRRLEYQEAASLPSQAKQMSSARYLIDRLVNSGRGHWWHILNLAQDGGDIVLRCSPVFLRPGRSSCLYKAKCWSTPGVIMVFTWTKVGWPKHYQEDCLSHYTDLEAEEWPGDCDWFRNQFWALKKRCNRIELKTHPTQLLSRRKFRNFPCPKVGRGAMPSLLAQHFPVGPENPTKPAL